MRKKFFNYFLIIYFIITLLFFSLSTIIFLSTDLYKSKRDFYLNKVFNAGRFEYVYMPKIFFNLALGKLKKIDEIYLNLSFKNLLTIEESRDKAIKMFSNESFDPEIFKTANASINYKDETLKGSIRLKGDRDIHWREKKNSSYKINLERDNYLFNMNKFSIQKPRARNYVHEWIYLELSEQENLIKIDYKFVNLNINGENFGLYVLEEGFNKDLLEKNGRRNGPIFSLNEKFTTDPSEPVFKVYNEKIWLNKDNIDIFKKAKRNLQEFFKGNIQSEEIFDLEKWASYFAITDLSHTYHGLYAKSVKFYFNPISNLFEPIPFDGHRKKPNYSKYSKNYDSRLLIDILRQPSDTGLELESLFLWTKKFFFDNQNNLKRDFYTLYISELDKVSQDKYLKDFFNKKNKQINYINSKIYGDYFLYDNIHKYGPGIYYFDKKDYFYRSKIIQNRIENSELVLAIEDSKNQKILITNNYPKNGLKNKIKLGELFVEELVCYSKTQQNDTYFKVNKKINFFTDVEIDLKSRNLNNCQFIIISNKKNEYKNIKIDRINQIFKNKKNLQKINHTKKKYDYKDFFITEGKNLFLKKKKIIISETLWIPKHYTLNILPGESILLTDNAFIISNANIIAKCTKLLPCNINGEKNNFGGGILFLNNGNENYLNFVNFSYLSGLRTDFYFNDILISHKTKHISKNKYLDIAIEDRNLNSKLKSYLIFGAINFHQSNVQIKNTNFHTIYSEDALNIMNSNFNLEKINFTNIYSDAVDIDTGIGSFKEIYFEDVYNDALDFSNSKIDAELIFFKNIGDKMVSVGENSTANLKNLNGLKSSVGITSKDGSSTVVNDIILDDVKIPFASYKKKKLYNSANLIISKYKSNKYLVEYLKDKNSELILDGKNMEKIEKFPLKVIYRKQYELLQNI